MLSSLFLLGCEAREAEPDAGRTPRFDAASDADPRSLADLWSPDFGPPPEDMPTEIRWMHGRMWCPGERPPRVLPDGTSECSQVEVPTDPALQPPDLGCRVWPSRTQDVTTGRLTDQDLFIVCNPERTLCCSGGDDLAHPPPCGWNVWPFGFSSGAIHGPTPESEAWLVANNLRAVLPVSGAVPDDVVEAFPSALNNCHPICKAPACGP